MERSRYCPACGAALTVATAPSVGDRRKVVTVVFADVVGSTELGERVDDETLRWAMQRWFAAMGQTVERHGGTVERYVGDALMAVFGIPVAHEDDALRAVRTALDMRDEVAELHEELHGARGVELAVRIGLNTGEAVTGAAVAGGSFTTGDAVNVAARLEQAARPGEILLGRDTHRLVAHAVEAEAVEALTVKGKREPVEAFRLLGVARDAPPRPARSGTAMIDRVQEQWRVRSAFERAVTQRTCQLLTILGAAGVGKSRLVAETVASFGDAATVARGRCLPYGEGTTWWPLSEALGASGLLEQVAGDDPVIARAAQLLDPAGEPVTPDEAFWAVRAALEALARRRPLVLVIDDLQWAEPTFLDLLEHLADWVRDAPLALLAMGRPELLDVREGWGAMRSNNATVLVEPLAEADADELLRELAGAVPLGRRTAERILDVAEGNPLYVVEVVAMLGDGGDPEEIAVPPTIQALLDARLDRLRAPERAVIEAAAVEGKEFARESVWALVGDEAVGAHLRELERKDLVRPVGADTYRFRHQLIRDAAYEGIPKLRRALLHVRFADLLAARAPAADELLGYHLESAVRLRRELGEAEAATAALAARASSHLGAAGRRAAQRSDAGAAAGLLERAVALVANDEAARSALLPALGAQLFEAGRIGEAVRVLDEAARSEDARLNAWARVERELVRLEAESSAGTERALGVAEEALPVLERAGDHHGQGRAWFLRAHAASVVGRFDRADEAWEQAGACARRDGDEAELFVILGRRATAAVLGSTPVDEAIRRCEAFRERVAASPVAVALMVNPLASLHAMCGEFEAADALVREANETLHQLGSLGWVSHHEALVRLLAGRPDLAELPLRAGLERLARYEDRGMLATTAAMLAQALYAQDRLAEADEQCAVAARAAAGDDIVTQAIWRGVKAKLLAREGRLEKAEALARGAVEMVEPTDLLTHRGDALLDLAEVLSAQSPESEYQRIVDLALSRYQAKGNAVGAARARSLLGRLSGGRNAVQRQFREGHRP
jgi:class 3 adenylate cyclase/tetratricopeptide (TPR) repeat protein